MSLVFSLLLLVPAEVPALFLPPSMAPVFLDKPRPKGQPKKIVSVAPSVTELIFALGAGERIAGVSRYDDYPEAVKALPKVGGFLDPNLEAIVALAPDLV